MSEQSCTTKDGLSACTPAALSDQACGCSSANQAKQPDKTEPQKSNSVVSAVLLGVACLTSPCCVPLIAPIILGLLAGTQVALWFANNMGWMYAGLTLVSMVSFLLVWRYAFQKLSLAARDSR